MSKTLGQGVTATSIKIGFVLIDYSSVVQFIHNTAGNQVQLIPVADLPNVFECIGIIEGRKHCRLLTLSQRGAHDLSTKGAIGPRRHSAPCSGATLDQRAGIAVHVIDVGLVTACFPPRHSVARNFAEPRRTVATRSRGDRRATRGPCW